MPTRRSFLASTAAAFAFRDDTVRRLARLDPGAADPHDDDFWTALRGEFDVPDDASYFNHAGLAPSPRAVREAMAAQVRRANAMPGRVLWREQDRELETVRERLARLVGCSAEELALTPNATHGLHTAILGIDLEPGDEILTTTHDYSRALNAIRQRERRDGATAVRVPLDSPPAAPEDVAADILAHFTSRTRLVVLSQLTYLTGQRLPVRTIADHATRRGVPVLIDGAHGIGLLPETMDDLGGSLYTACLHKWLMGPIGTGVFAVRSAWIDKIWPLHPADESRDRCTTKYEQWGTRPAAPLLALGEALDFHDRLGTDAKAARLEALRQRLGAALCGEPGVRHHGSLDPDRCRAMLTVALDTVDAPALARWLWQEHRVFVTTVDCADLRALRISPNVFTTHAEVDRLAALLRGAARDGI